VNVTTETLLGRSACAPGIAWFEAAFPDGFAGEWTADHQRWLIASGGARWLGWAWGSGVLPAWSMAGQDWSGADLTGADLTGADLWEADLTGANLTGANLTRAVGLSEPA